MQSVLFSAMSSSVKSCSLNSTDGAHHREKTQSKRQVSQNEIQQHDQAAAIFFAKAAQKFNIPAKKKTRKSYQKSQYDLAEENEDDIQLFPTNFSRCVSRSPPSNPPGLFKYMGRRVDGKVKIMLRIAASPSDNGSCVPLLRVDQRRKQVTLSEPKDKEDTSLKSLGLTSIPKLFAFDAIFESSATKTEICASSLLDVLHSVINGGYGCLLVYGSGGLGKTDTMIGRDDSTPGLGVIPCAISWLYTLIEDSKQRNGARFSVRVSAIEIVGRSENLKDLLSDQASGGSSTSSNGTSPGIYLREDPIGGVQLSNLSELRAPTAEKASFYLDAALAARTNVPVHGKESLDITEYQGSHMIFTLHVYQYRIDKTGRGGLQGGRSRLHLIDLSAWPKDSFNDGISHTAPSQGALGKILLSMLNGTKQVAHKDSKIARLLKDSVGNPTCRTTIINHVSPDEDRYTDTLATLEMASKISRSRRRKNKYCSASSSGGESSCDEGKLSKRLPRPPAVRTCGIDATTAKVDISDYTSSAGEDSCDTVIYVGPNGRISDQDLTDNEGPPIEHGISNSVSLSGHDKVSHQQMQYMNKKVNVVKPLTTLVSNDSEENNDSEEVDSTPVTPVKIVSTSSKGKSYIGDFIVSDCEDMDGRRSPSFGPRFRPETRPGGEANTEMVSGMDQPIVSELSKKNIQAVELNTDDDGNENEDDEIERIDICSAIKSSRNAVKNDQNANEATKEEGVIEVFVEDEQKKDGTDLNYVKLDESSKTIVSEIISKTRPEVDYFHHEVEDEDLSYLHMGPVTEKELRKSERRIRKLLKGGLVDNSHVHGRYLADDNYLSECETGQMKRELSQKYSSGYSSAPETENRRRRLQKIFAESAESGNDAATPDSTNSVSARAKSFKSEGRASSPTKRLSAEETRSLLKDFVAKKIEERALSPDRTTFVTSESTRSDLVDQNEAFVVSSYAEVKYIPTCKANITSTRLCRGSVNSVLSSEANSFSPPSSETSYDKADTVSMASYAGSEDRNCVAGLCSPSGDSVGRRRRSPVKIHYRWSTVFEEDEKSKHSSQKPVVSSDKKASENKKTKSNKKAEAPVKPGSSKSPKCESKVAKKSPKVEVKRDKSSKNSKDIAKSPNISKPLRANEVGNSSSSVSGLSELSESSGIASNDNSSLSQHSVQSSPLASIRDRPLNSATSPISPRTRRWFFSRKPRSSGYVSDGNITDSSRMSSHSRRLFGSKSKLSIGHSSGYESMRTENASGAESACELDGSGRRRKKRFLGFRRRSLSDLSKRGRTKRSYWIDNPASDNEGVEYTVYQIEDIDQRVQRSKSQELNVNKRSDRQLLENHRRRVLGLTEQKSALETELDQAMNKLMLEKEKYKDPKTLTQMIRSMPMSLRERLASFRSGCAS